MQFNEHYNLEGRHAFLSASNHAWVNDDIPKLLTRYSNAQARRRGTELHEFARRAIELGIKLPKSKKTLNLYVNDAIGYRMSPERVLYYSDNAFGTADAISFKRGLLRIHDLKTGVTPASMVQLEIYAAYFCLEYNKDPHSINSELRIYQSNEVLVSEPDPDRIEELMNKVIEADKAINEFNEFNSEE